MVDQQSDFSFIDLKTENPFILFQEWQNEASENGNPYFHTNSMCLATSSKNGRVGNRTVVLKEVDDDGFIFVTTKNGRKYQEILDNPMVAATCMWNYTKDGETVLRQVRIEGKAVEISRDLCRKYYDAEPLYCKIRAYVCHQGDEVNWDELKKNHDSLVNDVVTNNKELPMPDHFVGYKIVPDRFDFYYTISYCIADRLVFTNDEENIWKWTRIAS